MLCLCKLKETNKMRFLPSQFLWTGAHHKMNWNSVYRLLASQMWEIYLQKVWNVYSKTLYSKYTMIQCFGTVIFKRFFEEFSWSSRLHLFDQNTKKWNISPLPLVTHDPSENILICCAAQRRFLENRCTASYFCRNKWYIICQDSLRNIYLTYLKQKYFETLYIFIV